MESLKTDENLRDIVRKMTDNPEILDTIPDEDIIALKKRINPIGTITVPEKSYAVVSIVNMKERTARQLLITALIGFMYRRLSEYTPEYVDDTATRMQKGINDERDQEKRDKMRADRESFISKHTDAHRVIIRDFLNSMFLFDPDKHVRVAPSKLPVNAYDIITGAASIIDEQPTAAASADAGHTSDDFNEIKAKVLSDATVSIREEMQKMQKRSATPLGTVDAANLITEMASTVHKASRISHRTCEMLVQLITNIIAREKEAGVTNITDLEHCQSTAIKQREILVNAEYEVAPMIHDSPIDDVQDILKINPPADTFYHFERYLNAHYDILHVITSLLYNQAAEIENMLVYYDSFDKQEEAREFVRVHESEFSIEPQIVENNGVTLLGPFHENRERVDIFSKNTEILRIMTEQLTKDQQLGKELTKKRITTAKRKNIRETGADDVDGLERYINARGIVKTYGKRPELSREEREKLTVAEQDCAEYETPEGAVAIRVLAPQLDEKGTPVDIKQSFFYSEAEHAMQSK